MLLPAACGCSAAVRLVSSDLVLVVVVESAGTVDVSITHCVKRVQI